MRITTSQLRRIIKEEARRAVLNEVFEGDARVELIDAVKAFKASYVRLEKKLSNAVMDAKAAGASSFDIEQVISQNATDEQSGSTANAIRGMEVVKQRDTARNIGF